MQNLLFITILVIQLLQDSTCFQQVHLKLFRIFQSRKSIIQDLVVVGGGICASNNDENMVDAELIGDDDDDDNDNFKMAKEQYDWIPDREKARIARENSWKHAEADLSTTFMNKDVKDQQDTSSSSSSRSDKREKRLTYTDEEEELIAVLGGKEGSNSNGKRESGFLGDSTLREISMDFQVPICYLGDVLCSWGVTPPIDPNAMLGDMVTGEQAFAILEAIHTLDVGSLNDRYAEFDLATLCNEYEIELSDGFELAMKEGWNLPFGVRTFLRVEQEEFLKDKLAKDIW